MSRSASVPTTERETQTVEKSVVRRLPPYQVVLENDDHHTFEFVIAVLRKVLGCDEAKAARFAYTAHDTGRAIIWVGSKEVAELKVEQVQSFHEILGNNRPIGPLGVYLEPAA